MSGYSEFSAVYDCLMADAQYPERTGYILSLFEKYGKEPTLLLDLACGTGSFTLEFAKRGIETIGVDMSEEMLSIAREKAFDEAVNILFLCQKGEELDLYGTVDGAVCCMDSVNHITDIESLEKVIAKVSLFMEKDSLFIFDVNTPYKHEKVLGNNTFVFEEDDIFGVWQNTYNKDTCITDICLDFFVATQDGMYERFSEEISERAYTVKELENILKKYDFEVLAVLGDMSQESVKETDERAYFVAKKVRETNGYYE